MRKSVGIIYACVLFSIACAQEYEFKGQGWWMQQPYTADDEFTILAEYGENTTITFNTSLLATVDYWIIPDLRVMRDGDEFSFRTLDGDSMWKVEGDTMEIILVQEEHFGFYHIVGTDSSGNVVVIKRALNYRGPYFGDLWDDYRMNTIVGCSSAAVFLFITAITYTIYVCKFANDESEEEEKQQEEPYYTVPDKTGSKHENIPASYDNKMYDAHQDDVIIRQPKEDFHEISTEL